MSDISAREAHFANLTIVQSFVTAPRVRKPFVLPPAGPMVVQQNSPLAAAQSTAPAVVTTRVRKPFVMPQAEAAVAQQNAASTAALPVAPAIVATRVRQPFVMPKDAAEVAVDAPLPPSAGTPADNREPPPLVKGKATQHPGLDWVAAKHLTLVERNIEDLVIGNRALRRRSEAVSKSIEASIAEFGLINPIVTAGTRVVVGHGRLKAAKALGYNTVPTIDISYLTEDQRRAYAIAENKLGELSNWDQKFLGEEIRSLYSLKLDFDLRLVTGIPSLEFDTLTLVEPSSEKNDPADATMPLAPHAVSRLGDVLILGDHRLMCGSAADPQAYAALMPGGEQARMLFGDPPWGVAITGHAGNKGRIKHREFVEGGADMSPEELLVLFTDSQRLAATASVDGALHFWCIDWAHVRLMLEAGDGIYTELKNIIVWVKPNFGMGSCYRSQHELIVLQKVGSAPHLNNFGLGQVGRVRTNCWTYAGANSFGKQRDEMLAMHPTVKPVAMVVDAIQDCTYQNDIVLDPFGGSGTTLIAAEKTKRRARLIELDPLYVDTIVMRWQKVTGRQAIRESDGQTFDALATGDTTATDTSRAEVSHV